MVMFFCSALAVVMLLHVQLCLHYFVPIFYITFFASNTPKRMKRIIGLLLVGVLFATPFAERAFYWSC